MKEKLMKLLRVIFTQYCWIQVDQYSPEYDRWIRSSLKNPVFKYSSAYYIFLNGKKIWIKNYPYGYGTIHSGRPSRRTMFRLKDAVDNYLLNNIDEDGKLKKLKIVN